jgi:hypothetical protein
MKHEFYLITEDQLQKLQVIAWGARMIFSHEPKAFNDTIDAIRSNPLSYDPYNAQFRLHHETQARTPPTA